MKSTLLQTLALIILASLSGCGDDAHTPTKLAQEPQRQDAPLWKIRYVAACSDRKPQLCTGAYGFAIRYSGAFLIGPGPDGQKSSGTLSREDLKAVSVALAPFTARVGGTLNCASGPTTGTTSETVQLQMRSGESEIVRSSGDGLCGASGSQEEAQALRDALRRIVAKYHPKEFPNSCIDAAQALERTYDRLRRCESNSDCSYVDGTYLPIDPALGDPIVTDDCTHIRPMIVANGFSAVTHQLDLVMKRELARRVCGPDLSRRGCVQPLSMQFPEHSPSCVRGTCRVQTSLQEVH